jgi:hypothetical protein
MRRSLVHLAVAAVLLNAPVAPAAEEGAPVTISESSSSSAETTSSADSGASGIHARGALLDKDDTSHRGVMLSFNFELPWGRYWLPYGAGFGVGARLAFPIVKGGFVPGWNDSFWLEFGVDTGYYFGGGFGFGIVIPAEAFWMVHLLKFGGNKALAVYAKLSFGIAFVVSNYCAYVPGTGGACANVWPFFHGTGGLGAVLWLTDNFGLRAEANFGYDSNFKAGISLGF